MLGMDALWAVIVYFKRCKHTIICMGAHMASQPKANACLARIVLIGLGTPYVWVPTWHPNLKRMHVCQAMLLFSFKDDRNFGLI